MMAEELTTTVLAHWAQALFSAGSLTKESCHAIKKQASLGEQSAKD
jgi:hypothetical protein